ncbi:MAG: hypothetical protein DMG31_13345 [Acidobacteria bacterium]|nr:MAG: hypothetical protein DMG31_13345 [Acidobacteriota bacterium]
MREKVRKPSAKIYAVIFGLLQLLALYQLSSALAYGAPQEQQRRALGSLTTVGEVHVNDAVAPSDAPIFAGDVLRSAGTGSATFTWSGTGSLQIYPHTEIVFTGEPQYAAELKFGRVVMNSWGGATGMNLRAGNSVVLAVAEGEQSVSNIEAPSDGSFLVTCEAGSVGVIPLQGGNGIFIQAGQSVSISAQGELSAMGPQAGPSAGPISKEPVRDVRPPRSYRRWILIALGTAGAGAVAGILSSRRPGTPSNGPSVSPTPTSSSSASSSTPTSTSSSSPSPSNPAPPNNNPPSNPSNPAPPSPIPPLPLPPPLTIHLVVRF